MTFVFENRETFRFQIQEIARVEQLITDADIQIELDTYNPMIPEPGQLCATMFIELTSDDQSASGSPSSSASSGRRCRCSPPATACAPWSTSSTGRA